MIAEHEMAKHHGRRIGGSDIPKLLGVSPYGGPLEVYERIVLGVRAPWNPRMQRGINEEPKLRKYGADVLRLELEERDSDYHPHPSMDFAHAQVDDLAVWDGHSVVVDYKTVNRWVKGWGAPMTDAVPAHIRAQLAWEMLCCDRDLGLLVVGFGEDGPTPESFVMANVVTYQVERDPLFEAECVRVAEKFWLEHVLPEVPPAQTQPGKKKRAKS